MGRVCTRGQTLRHEQFAQQPAQQFFARRQHCCGRRIAARTGGIDAVFQADISQLINPRQSEIRIVKLVHNLQDLVVLSKNSAQRIEFLRISVSTWYRLQPLIHVNKACRQSNGAGLKTFGQ